jgi:thymidylate synthase (FAD)
MTVNLISISQPKIEGIDKAEDLIAYCARVSNPSNQMNTETAPKLLKYLIKHAHWSPFEMASMTLEITTSRAISAQILRHRSFSFQEFSQRYSEATKICDIELRKQGKTNRQVSDDPFDPNLTFNVKASKEISILNSNAIQLYNELIEAGIARECARMILPLATQTTLYMAGTLRSWIHYIELRSSEHTQKEHRDIAIECKNIFNKEFPIIGEALEWI